MKEIDIKLTIVEVECSHCGHRLDDFTRRDHTFTITDEDVREMSSWEDADFYEVKNWFCEVVAFHTLDSNEQMEVDSSEINRLVAFVAEHRNRDEVEVE